MNGATPFFRPGGTMDPASPSYIEREADGQLFDALMKGEYVFLLDSRQKGKSSMIARAIVKLKEQGVATVKLDLQRVGANVTPEQWYAGLLGEIGQELGISDPLFAYWKENQAVGPLARWIGALQNVVLEKIETPLVIFIDEIDFVRALPFPTDEFFAGIRDCFNRKSDVEAFRRLTFCLVGVATPGQLIRNPEITPFNVGLRIDISDFSLSETDDFANHLAVDGRDGPSLMERVHYWLNGHPYLTQLICSHIVADPSTRSKRGLDRLIRRLLISPESRQREPNLADVERRLLESEIPGFSPDEGRAQILEAYGRLLRRKKLYGAGDDPIVAALSLSGVAIKSKSAPRLRNEVYRRAFNESWRKANLPEAEARRLRRAARLAIMRTVAVAGAILTAVSALAFGMWRLSNQKETALNDLAGRTKELNRAGELREKALNDLERSNSELANSAKQRLEAIRKLREQNETLTRLTQERQQALRKLVAQSGELEFQRYASNAYETRVMLDAHRWERVTELIKESKSNPNRGWEWGHLALRVGYLEPMGRYPRNSIFEPQLDGSIKVVSPEGVHSLDSGPTSLIEKWSRGSPYVPTFRAGPYRVVLTNDGRGNSIRDVNKGNVIVQAPSYSMILDVDASRGLYLQAEGKTLDVVQLKRIKDGSLVATYKGPGDTDAAQFLPDGSVLSAHAVESKKLEDVRRWNAKGQTLDSTEWPQFYAHRITLSPDRKRYTVWGADGEVEIRWVAGHRPISKFSAHQAEVTALEFSRDGKTVLIGCSDGALRLVDAETAELIRSLSGHNEPITSVGFLPNRAGWVSLDESGLMRRWSSASQTSLLEYKPHSKAVATSYVTANGRYLISAGRDGFIVSRDLVTGNVAKKGGGSYIARADGVNLIYHGRRDGSILVLDPKDLSVVKSRKIMDGSFLYMILLAGGQRIVARGQGRSILLLNAQSLNEIARFEPMATRQSETKNGVRIYDAMAFDENGTRIADYRGDSGLVRIYSSKDGSLVSKWDPGRVILRMAFIKGGKELVACMGEEVYVDDGMTVIFDSDSGHELTEINKGGPTIVWLDYAPKTGVLAGMDADGVVHLWNAKTRQPLPNIIGSPRADIFFMSPDGTRIITSSSTGAVQFFDAFTGIQRLGLTSGIPPAAPNMWGPAARFSADGRRVTLLSPDGWVRVWNSTAWISVKPMGKNVFVDRNAKR